MPKNKILAIHSRDGTMLQNLSCEWMTNVKPTIPAPYQVTPMFGKNASRQLNPLFSQIVSDQDVALITGLGHGSNDAFLGWDSETLYSSDLMPSAEVNDKVVHLLSCSTAGGLNTAFRRAGCRAFIGYKTKIEIESSTPEWTSNFLRCDSQVDLILASGQTVGAAVQAAKTWFSIYGMGSTGDSLMCDPQNGQVSLPPVTSMPAPAALVSRSISSRKLPDSNVIGNRSIIGAPDF